MNRRVKISQAPLDSNMYIFISLKGGNENEHVQQFYGTGNGS